MVAGTYDIADSSTLTRSEPVTLPTRPRINSHTLFPWSNGPFEKWAKKFVTKNYWRVATICQTPEDANQICATVFCECIHRYGDTVDNPAWLMSLYTRMVINHWNRLSILNKRERDMMAENLSIVGDDESPIDLLDNISAEPSQTSLFDVVASLPADLARVLRILMDAPAEVVDLLMEGRSQRMDNAAIRRICGISDDIDIIGELRRALSGKKSRYIRSIAPID